MFRILFILQKHRQSHTIPYAAIWNTILADSVQAVYHKLHRGTDLLLRVLHCGGTTGPRRRYALLLC